MRLRRKRPPSGGTYLEGGSVLPLRRGLGSLQILVPSSRSSQVDREPLPSDRELFSEGFSATESGPRLEPFLRPDEAETVAPEAIRMESLTGCGW